MPANTGPTATVKGKVLQTGVRTGETNTVPPRSYAYTWAQVLDSSLREIVEVTTDISDGAYDPFGELRRGQFVELPVGRARVYHGMVTYSLWVEPEAEAEPTEAEAGYVGPDF